MKLLGNYIYKKQIKSVFHYMVPMSSALLIKKGEEANVHSGALAICSFAVLGVHNKKKELAGNLFIHQGNEVLKLKKDSDCTYELLLFQTAPNTKHGTGDTADDLTKFLDTFGIKNSDCIKASQVAEKEGILSFYSTATVAVGKDGTVEKVESSTSGYNQKDGGLQCTLL